MIKYVCFIQQHELLHICFALVCNVIYERILLENMEMNKSIVNLTNWKITDETDWYYDTIIQWYNESHIYKPTLPGLSTTIAILGKNMDN